MPELELEQNLLTAPSVNLEYFDGASWFNLATEYFVLQTPVNTLPVTGNINLSNHRITNASDPIDSQDLATKAFVLANTPAAIVTLAGFVTGSGNTGSTITTHLARIQNLDYESYQTNFPSLMTTQYAQYYNLGADIDGNAVFINGVNSANNELYGYKYTFQPSNNISIMDFVYGGNSLNAIFISLKRQGTNFYTFFNYGLDVKGKTITSVGTPVNSTDAVNKAYIDNKVISLSGAINGSGGLTDLLIEKNEDGTLSTSINTTLNSTQIFEFSDFIVNFLPLSNPGNYTKTLNLTPGINNSSLYKDTITCADASFYDYYIIRNSLTSGGDALLAKAFAAKIDSKDYQFLELDLGITAGTKEINTFKIKLGCDLDVNSKKIINVATPVNSTDAVNKDFIDNKTLELTGSIHGTGVLSGTINTKLSSIQDLDFSTLDFNFNPAVTDGKYASNRTLKAFNTVTILIDKVKCGNDYIITEYAFADIPNGVHNMTNKFKGTIGGIDLDFFGFGASKVGDTIYSGISYYCDINMQQHAISNLKDPVYDGDAVNLITLNNKLSAISLPLNFVGDVTGSGNSANNITLHLGSNINPSFKDFNINYPTVTTVGDYNKVASTLLGDSNGNCQLSNIVRNVDGTNSIITNTAFIPMWQASIMEVIWQGTTGNQPIFSFMKYGAPSTYLANLYIPLSMNSQQITNLGTPTTSTSAATKGYVDSKLAALLSRLENLENQIYN